MIGAVPSPLIWPLLDRLSPTTAAQARPKSAGNQGLTRIPAAPWDDADRPIGPQYGQVEGTPRLWEFADWNFGLSALRVQRKRLVEFKTNPRALRVSAQVREPAVIKPLIAGLPKLPPGPSEPNYYKSRRPLVWPLLDRLNPTVAMQMRPKALGNLGVTRPPATPWDDGDRPPVVGYGRVEGTPRLWEVAPWNFALSALNLQQKRIVEFRTNPRALVISEQRNEPAVVRPLKLPARVATISGITRVLSTGVPLGSCVVELYLTATDEPLMKTTSDANGYFIFSVARFSPATHYMVAYKVGAPDVAGTTLNTLTGTG